MNPYQTSFLTVGLAFALQAPVQAQSRPETSRLTSMQARLVAADTPTPVRLEIRKFTASPSEILQGKAATLSFIFDGGAGTISDGARVVAVRSGVDLVVTPTTTTTYTLTVTPLGARPISRSLVVTVRPSRFIKGSSQVTYINSLGETTISNPSIPSIRFMQQDPSGAWMNCGAVADGDGRFHSAERLGEDPYWVYHNNGWYQVSRDEIFLQSARAGRPTMPMAGEGTAIHVGLTGFEPLFSSDNFYLCAPNLDSAARASVRDGSFDGIWQTGMTNLRGSFNWTYRRQLAGRQGDKLIALMSRNQPTQSYPIIRTISRSLLFQPMDLSSGQVLSLAGEMKEPPMETLDLKVLSSEFAQALTQSEPAVTLLPLTTRVLAERFASSGQRASSFTLPELLILQTRSGDVLSDVNLSGFVLPNPYQGDRRLTKTLGAYLTFYAEYTAYGAENPGGLGGYIYVKADERSASSGPLRPVVSQVQGVRINNADLAAPLTNVGLTPVLQWDPPAQGKPYAYNVWVCEVTNEGNETVLYSTASLWTPETRLAIPEGLLETGKTYVFEIRAQWAEGVEELLQPAMNDANSGFADYLTHPVLTTTHPRPAIQNFTGISLGAGLGISLSWKVLGADSVVLEPGNISLPLEGELTALPPVATNYYLLTATNKMGSTECYIEVDPQGKVVAVTKVPPGATDSRQKMPTVKAALPEDSSRP